MNKLACFLILSAIQVLAATPIRDTVYYANGKPAEGYLKIEWPNFVTGGGIPVAAGSMTINVRDGIINTQLQATDGANPSTVYTVRYYLRNAPVSVEYWSVPASDTAVGLTTLRILPPSLISTMRVNLEQITQGTAQVGQCIAWNGVSWVPQNCAAGGTDATQIQGRDVSSTAPSGNQVLTWSQESGQWEAKTLNTDQLQEGSINQYYTASRARSAVSAIGPVSYDSLTGTISCPECKTSDAVSSVFGRTGKVEAQAGDYDVAQVTGLQNALDEKAAASDLAAHTSRSDNPHSVTAQQVGMDVAQWNANRLLGQVISVSMPEDGQMLRYNGTTSQWEAVTMVDQETPAGNIDGTNSVFVLSKAPVPMNSLILFRNGIAQKRGEDYNLAGSTATFSAGSIPQPGDILLAWYRY